MTISKRLQRAEAAVPPRAQGYSEFESLLACLGEIEVRELQAVALRPRAGELEQDEAWLSAIADMRARIEARATLPIQIQRHLRCGTDGPWSLDAEIVFVRRQLASDFEHWGIKADLSGLDLDDLATLIDMRLSNPGIANIGWTFAKVGLPVAENLCQRIGVDLLRLPGLEEELIGSPASELNLFERWKAAAKSSYHFRQ